MGVAEGAPLKCLTASGLRGEGVAKGRNTSRFVMVGGGPSPILYYSFYFALKKNKK